MNCQKRTSYFYKESWKVVLLKHPRSGDSDPLCQHAACEHWTEHHSLGEMCLTSQIIHQSAASITRSREDFSSSFLAMQAMWPMLSGLEVTLAQVIFWAQHQEAQSLSGCLSVHLPSCPFPPPFFCSVFLCVYHLHISHTCYLCTVRTQEV